MKSIEFAINRVNHLVQEGDVVSLDKNGVLRQGAGTTLYRNIQEIHNWGAPTCGTVEELRRLTLASLLA